MTKEKNIEEKILLAAKEIFIVKGYDGARMQEIADLAGINKALLHYYFRSKDKLFEAILNDAIGKIIPKISFTLLSNITFEEKIEFVINEYIQLLQENPFLPIFILHELTKDPTKIKEILIKLGLKPELIIAGIKLELDNKKIKHIDSLNLIINIISMCVFPFAGKPLLKEMFFCGDNKAFDEFINDRKIQIRNFIYAAIFLKAPSKT